MFHLSQEIPYPLAGEVVVSATFRGDDGPGLNCHVPTTN